METVTSSNLILLDIHCDGKEHAIRTISQSVYGAGRLTDVNTYIAAVLEREKEFPTAVGFEFAIPHGKTDAVLYPTVAFARLTEPVIWEDEEQVRYIVLLAIPASVAGDEHMMLIAQLSRKLMSSSFRETLTRHTDPSILAELINNLQIDRSH